MRLSVENVKCIIEDKALLYLTVFLSGLAAGTILNRYICTVLRKESVFRRSFFLCLVNALLYLWIAAGGEWQMEKALFCLCASCLLAVGIIDGKTFEIPLTCNVFIGMLGGIRLLCDWENWREYAVGFFMAGSLFMIIFLFTKGKGVGGGDIKLMAAAGLFLGKNKILPALFAGSAVGAAVHLFRMKWQGKDRILAYGPYLSLGIFWAMVYGDGIIF